MEYTRPEVKTLHPDDIWRLRDRLKAELNLLDKVADNMIQSECHLCHKTGWGYEDTPQGWDWVYDYPALLCSDCIKRWTDRFGAPRLRRDEL